MQGRRILVFLVLFLITLPVVTAVADAAEKSVNEGLLIRLGELHEGERFVFDLHLTSTYRDLDWHVPAFVDISISRDRSFEALDGSIHDVLVAKTMHKMSDRLTPLDDGETEAMNRTQYLRLEDGVYVERLEERRSSAWDEHDGQTERRHANDVRRIEGSANGGDMFGRGLHPGDVFVNGNVVQEVLSSVVVQTAGRVHEVGEWNGEQVFEVAGSAWTTTGPGRQFRCASEHPELDYTDFTDEPMASRILQEDYVRRAWIKPGVAFPVLNECRATYTDGAQVVEEVRFTLELAHHEPGGQEIPVDWDRMNRRDNYAPAGSLEAAPTPHAGVPRGGQALGVPLSDAVGLVAGHDHPDLNTWKDDGPQPFYVVWAHYMPRITTVSRPLEAPSGPVPDPTPVPLPDPTNPPDPTIPPDPTQPPNGSEEEGTEERLIGISWSLELSNKAGETRSVRVTYNGTSAGGFEDGHVEGVEESYPQDPLVDGRLTDSLVPLDDLVDRFVTEAAPSDDWLEQRYAHVTLHNRITDHGDRGYRAGHTVTFEAKDPDAPADDPRGRRVVREYDTRDGAPLQAGRAESWSVEGAAPPDGPRYGPASAAPASVLRDFPAAATASGFVLATGFVVAFFWDAVARTFGQFVGAPLYAKIRRDKVLDHRTRDMIVSAVQENPGIAVEELRRELGVGYGTVCHHLETLQRNELLTSRKVGRRRCYFVPGAVDAGEMTALGTAGTQAAARLLEVVTAEPGLTQTEIAARLGVADSSVRYQAKRLLAHERLRAEREGRSVRYYPMDAAAA